MLPASTKTVYRVQNCSPHRIILRFLWARNCKTFFRTKFKYTRRLMLINTPENFKTFLYLLFPAESWAKKGKPSWNWSSNRIWWNDVECPRLLRISLEAELIFSSCCYHKPFSKTERNGTRHDSSGGVIKRGSFGPGRVGWTPFFTRLFRSALTIALFTVHFVLLAERLNRLCYHSISCQTKK